MIHSNFLPNRHFRRNRWNLWIVTSLY